MRKIKKISVKNPIKRANKLFRIGYKLNPDSKHRITQEIQDLIQWRICDNF